MWWVVVATVRAQDCESVSLGDITAPAPPAIVVLGERKGHQPDLRRAYKVVKKLSKQAPVTLALEAVRHEHQDVLDRYERGAVDPGDLPGLLDWEDTWGFPYTPYEELVTASLDGVHVVGAGLALGPRPATESIPLPPGYMNVLGDAFGDHPVPVELEPSLIEAMAWRDHAIARAAIGGWSREGYLVIVADRFHVEGGLGIAWQAQRLAQDVPVSAAVLASADDPCFRGDRIWR